MKRILVGGSILAMVGIYVLGILVSGRVLWPIPETRLRYEGISPNGTYEVRIVESWLLFGDPGDFHIDITKGGSRPVRHEHFPTAFGHWTPSAGDWISESVVNFGNHPRAGDELRTCKSATLVVEHEMDARIPYVTILVPYVHRDGLGEGESLYHSSHESFLLLDSEPGSHYEFPIRVLLDDCRQMALTVRTSAAAGPSHIGQANYLSSAYLVPEGTDEIGDVVIRIAADGISVENDVLVETQ